MEVGQYKIGAIIQGRLSSTRLPGKILLPLPLRSEETVISQIIKTLNRISYLDKIVVATSSISSNDDLENHIKKLGIECFRGEENDVLSRFYEITQLHDFDFVIRFTADNPIIDISLLESFVENCITKDLEYSYSTGLPLGANFEIMKSSAIRKAYGNSTSSYDREHVTPYLKRNSKKTENYQFINFLGNDKIRLTIDYPSDYAFIQMIYFMLNRNEKSIKNIINLTQKNPWLLEINNNNVQKRNFQNLQEEIKYILPILEKMELYQLLEFLKNGRS